MPTPIIIRLIIVVLCFAGCRTLRSSQIQSVAEFAAAARAVVQTPPKIYKEFYALKDEPRILKNSVTFATDTDSTLKYPLKELHSVYTQMQANAAAIQGYGATLGILESFGTLLQTLADTRYLDAFAKQQGEFAIRLDSLVRKHNYLQPDHPVAPSLTKVITGVLDALANRAIKSAQRKYIAALLVAGESSVKALCTLYTETIGPATTANIQRLEGELQNDFKEYVMNLKASNKNIYSDPVVFQEKVIPIYLDWAARQKRLLQLQTASVAGMKSMVTVYEVLLHKIKAKASLKETIAEMKTLQQSVSAIKDAYDTYAEEKEKLKVLTSTPKN